MIKSQRGVRAAGVALLLGGLMLVLTAFAPPASAHGGDAVFTVETNEPQEDGSIHYVVRITWKNDGHAALNSTVTATPVDAAGAAQTPVPLTAVDQDGRYEATVAFPSSGAWKVRFASISPNGSMERDEQVTLPSSTTAEATTTTAAEVPTTTSDGASSEGAASSSQSDDDSGGSAAPVIAAVVVAALAAGGVVWFLRRGRSTPGPDPENA